MKLCDIKELAETLVFDSASENECRHPGVFYGRGLVIKHGNEKGNLYTTSEFYKKGDEHFPIFESVDGGKSWTHVSDVYDSEFTEKKYKAEASEELTTYKNENWKMLFQPMLFEMPADMGSIKKGDVLCVGTTVSENHCAIVIYHSGDNLRSWKYISTVAEGGKCRMETGSAIWEGFLVYENNALYCFFSDERGMIQGGGQKLVFAKTMDGINWENPVDVCNFEEENPYFRPGMPIVTRLSDGRYFMVYEGVKMRQGDHPTYYKITEDIENWRPYEREDGIMPYPFECGSPYCIVLEDGRLVVGAHGTNKVAVNADSLKTETWKIYDTHIGNAYTRCLLPLEGNRFMVVSAGAYGAPGYHKLTISIESIA